MAYFTSCLKESVSHLNAIPQAYLLIPFIAILKRITDISIGAVYDIISTRHVDQMGLYHPAINTEVA